MISAKEAAARGSGGQVRYALCFFGLIRSLQWTLDSIERHILAQLQSNATVRYDVFVHTYRAARLDNPRAGETGVAHADPIADVQRLHPTRYLITSQDDLDMVYPDVHLLSPLEWLYNENTTIQNIFRAQNSLSLSWAVMANYAAEHHIDYAGVVILRPDVLYLRDLDIVRQGILPEHTVFVANFGHYGGCNDRFAYGHASAMRVYAHRLDTMVGSTALPAKRVNSEQLLVHHLQAHNINVTLVDMLFARIRSTGQVPRLDMKILRRACTQHAAGACHAYHHSEEVTKQLAIAVIEKSAEQAPQVLDEQ
ncbi:hypothetical protein JKP88DRAFT_206066 [Tribonema minus]|uniref:DUF7796 domain-containing protein n=1 Tax=Tribonema minus TaxID=303371 RepID=A0A836CL92_9STRA|nr:hypothetical protein JKP88DRAFT_206066 [Tribonema minus]